MARPTGSNGLMPFAQPNLMPMVLSGPCVNTARSKRSAIHQHQDGTSRTANRPNRSWKNSPRKAILPCHGGRSKEFLHGSIGWKCF